MATISLSHIVMFFLISGVLFWTMVIVAGINVILTWIEDAFTRLVRARRAVRIYRHHA